MTTFFDRTTGAEVEELISTHSLHYNKKRDPGPPDAGLVLLRNINQGITGRLERNLEVFEGQIRWHVVDAVNTLLE